MKLSIIANYLNGELIGEDIEVSSIKSLETATSSDLTILLDKKYLRLAKTTKASAIISDSIDLTCPSIIKVANPRSILSKAISLFSYPDTRVGISKLADIANCAIIGKGVYIDSFVKIDEGSVISDGVRIYSGTHIGKNSSIGENTILFANVSIYDDIFIGKNCLIHSGAVIGADGFGFERNANKEWIKIPQIGKVNIGDNVEIGANTCIDRGCLQDTIIKEGVKLDNLVQIAHNCSIGKHSLLASVCAIAGSTTIGEYNLFAGDVGTTGHLTTGSNVTVMARAGITKNIEDGLIVRGFPAREQKEAIKDEAVLKKLVKKYKEKKNEKMVN
jgi:UDP-3-O-[3-hydroxymyristoyl] glucosamine N-acyltransferase